MTTILAIGAHPDDETMLAGGTLAWAAQHGFKVDVLSVTRGEGGERGEPPVAAQADLGTARAAELRAAAAALGVHEVDFLPYEDPLIEDTGQDPAPATALFRIAATLDEFTAAIVAVIRRLHADILFTHGSTGEYGHPQHIYTHEAVVAAFAAAGDPAQYPEAGPAYAPTALYVWAAGYPTNGEPRLERLLNQAEPADWILHLDDQLLDQKERAAQSHVSQMPLFLRRAEGKPLRAMLIPRESWHRLALREGTTDPFAAALAQDARAERVNKAQA